MAKNSRARGRAKALAGTVKQGIGKLIGDTQMETVGAVEILQGEADEASVKASERTLGAGQELSGAIKQSIGDLIGDPELSIEGQAEAIQGKKRNKANQ